MRILTFALCLLCFSVSAQNNSINVYPWNPDSDNDNQIGVDDLQSFLTVYGNSFGLPPEPCTYDGTDFGEFISNVLNETIVVDSVFIEYELEDVSTYYLAGCPDPITDTVVMVVSQLHDSFSFNNSGSYHFWRWNVGYTGTRFEIKFYPSSGGYEFTYDNSELLGDLAADGFFHDRHDVNWNFSSSNFDLFGFDESGLDIPWTSGGSGTFSYANYLHILPYWHYADE